MGVFLIDTQILIWTLETPSKVSNQIKEILEDLDNEIFISQISLFEISIKTSIGKIKVDRKINDWVKSIKASSISILPIEISHFKCFEQLPIYKIHKDPFDRLIIATAIAEGFTLISSDQNFPLYQPELSLIQV